MWAYWLKATQVDKLARNTSWSIKVFNVLCFDVLNELKTQCLVYNKYLIISYKINKIQNKINTYTRV